MSGRFHCSNIYLSIRSIKNARYRNRFLHLHRLLSSSLSIHSDVAAMRTTGQYSSILDLIRKLYRSEGWRVFYRGYFANSLGGNEKRCLLTHGWLTPISTLVLPAAGIDFALYEYLRRVYREKITALEEPSKDEKCSPRSLSFVVFVFKVYWLWRWYRMSVLLQQCMHRIHSIWFEPDNNIKSFQKTCSKWWERSGGKSIIPVRYRERAGLSDHRIDGWRGFYFGSLPNLIKVLPASTVAYLTFEYFSRLFDISG